MRRFVLSFLLFLDVVEAQQDMDSSVSAYRAAATSIDEDLRRSLDALAAQREEIAKEKPALSVETNRVAAELRESRRKADLARVSKDSAEAEFEKSTADLKAWRDERHYLEGLFLDFKKSRSLNDSNTAPASPEILEGIEKLKSQLDLVESVISEISQAGSVLTARGEVVSDEGVMTPGIFAKAGPLSWFLAEDKSLAGLVTEGPDLRPKIIDNTASAASIDAAIRGEMVTVSFDPTLGSAVALVESETSLLTHIKQGGFWIFPILLLAAIALAATLVKWMQLTKIREFGSAPVQRILDSLNAGNTDAAKAEASSIRHPAGNILTRGITFVEQNRSASRDDLEEALYEKFLEASPSLQRGLPLIAIASATAPLLGLLGTVTGMIETFRLINVFVTGDAKSLASGISEALITTEFGLIVAIPALILHALLSRRVQGIKASMEMASLAFLNGVKSS